MEFEDMFKKQRPPKDYVSAPAQQDPLTTFFRERTKAPAEKAPEANMFGRDFLKKPMPKNYKTSVAAITPELKEVAETAPKIAPEKVEEYKKIFRPEPTPEMGISEEEYAQEQAAQPVQPQMMAKSDLIDVEKVRRQADALAPQATTKDLLMGLIPIATSALMGGRGEGLDVAGKYMLGKADSLEKRKMSLEDKLMEIEKSRAIASAKGVKGNKNFQSVNIVDDATKKVIKANYNKDTGEYSLPDGTKLDGAAIEAGYSVIPEEWTRRAGISQANKKEAADYTPRLDPETNLLSRATPTGIVPIGQQKGKLNPKQQEDLTQITDKFISSPAYKTPAAAISAASNVENLLQLADSGNPAAANSARLQIARMAGEVGALSEADIESTGGDPSIKGKIKRFVNLQRTRVPLTPQDIVDLRQMTTIYERVARKKLSDAVMALDTSYVEELDGVKGSVQNKLKAYIPKEQKKGKGKPTPPPGMTFEQFKEWKKNNG